LADLRVRVGADVSEFQAKMGLVKGEIGGMGALDKVASVGIIGLAAVIAGVGVVSLKMAGDFQQATTQLVTGAGESNSALESVRAGILKMAPEVGQMPIDLAKGLFMIESAGYHGAAGLAVLRVSAEGAKVGGADLEVTSNAVTTVMKDYGISAENAGDATNFLVSVVKQGKTHMQDLAGSLSTVLPIASALHIPLADVGGAMATLTARGVPAAQAATYLRFTMSALAGETPKGTAALKDIGLTSQEVGDTMTTKGLLPALELINDHLKTKFPQGGAAMFSALKDITGGTRGLGAALGLTGDNLGTFTQSTANTAKAIKDGHGNVIGWTQAQGDLNFKIDQFKATLAAAATDIGMKMIPAVTKLAQDAMPGLISATGWLSDHLNVIAPVLGTVVGLFVGWKVALAAHAVVMGIWHAGALAIGIATDLWTAAQWLLNAALNANPIGLLCIAIVFLIGIGILLVTHWDQVKQFFESIWQGVVAHFQTTWNTIRDFLSGIWTGISTTATTAWNNITGFLTGCWTNISNTATTIWNNITGFFQRWGPFILIILTLGLALIVMIIIQHWQQISEITSTAWNNITGFLGTIWNGIAARATSTWNTIRDFISGVWNGISNIASTAWNNITGFLGGVWNGISTMASTAWNNIKANIVNPIVSVASTLAGVWSGIGTGMTNAWDGIYSRIVNTIGRIVSGIVEPFRNLHIPMPHFNVGSYKTNIAGVQFDVPQLDVKWYAKGGIFDSPTVLGGGVGVGEAGPEAAAPISELAKYLPDNSLKIVAAIEALGAKLAPADHSRTGGNLDKNALLRAFGSIMADYDYANQRGLMRPA
jgi:TP901 family phage tail tape measure protein